MREIYGKTDKGHVRANNEDSFCVLENGAGRLENLFGVADGMGGHKAGEVASRQALAYFCAYIKDYAGGFRYTQDLMCDAARHANREVFRISREDMSLNGMGTTLSAVSFDKDHLYYAHIGDSRVYIISDEGIRRVTSDHSLVAELVQKGEISEREAREHPQRNIMTRALGTDAEAAVDGGYEDFSPGDAALICSDGLCGLLDDEMIFDIILAYGKAEAAVGALIDKALELGGFDNITAVFIGKEGN